MTRPALLALALAGALAASGCNKRSPSATAAGAASASGPAVVPTDPVVKARMSEAWTRAEGGDVEELAALAVVEGSAGLEEGSVLDAAHRKVAIRAMAYAHGVGGVRWLAQIARDGTDEEAALALASLIDIAARPRTAVDAEDGDLLAEGCSVLGGVAKDAKRPKPRRVGAMRVLRMLGDVGLGPAGTAWCVQPADLPTDLDAREAAGP